MNNHPRWVYLVVSAAPPVLRIEELIARLSDDGWQVCLLATPTAASWIDLEDLTMTTGCRTRVTARAPSQQRSLPRADAVVAAPMTFNSINKWAAGISDSMALGVLNEILGANVPIIVAPCAKALLRQHPAYAHSVARLTAAGVTILDPDAVTTRGDDGLAVFEWSQVMSALTARVSH